MKNFIFLISLFPLLLCGQKERKTLPAYKSELPVQIDGQIDEAAWQEAPAAENFIMYQPDNGQAEPRAFRTRVKVFYTDEAVYLAAMMYDPYPDSILTQLTQRDDYDQNNDWFGFFINPYNDGLSDFNFFVTAAGVQADSKTTMNGDDLSLNSVWESAVAINDSGWVAEVRVPYLALRFPETPVKDWGLNMMRNIRRKRHTYSWSFLDVTSGYRLEFQTGLWQNMKNIDPPVRLSLMPYASAFIDDYRGQRNYDFNAGLDLKYGINESFTLDMTLLPDFGQVVYDQQFLNLSPFENRFDENRQFFTEGTELFNLGDLFYSRRIGGAPKNITGQALSSNDSVEIRQEYTRLLNATKISGRTNGNLGIGFLNAITADNYSTRIDTAGNESRLLTEPLTNYNVLVFDQRLNRNASVSFINTNVMRSGPSRDANVSGLLTSLFSGDGSHFLDAGFKYSTIFTKESNIGGYSAEMSFGKGDDKWRWNLYQYLVTEDYFINDLGFLARNNQHSSYGEISYNQLQPKGRYNRYSHTLASSISYLYKPYLFEEWQLRYSNFFLLRNFFAYGINVNAFPLSTYDYFEARQYGYKFRIPPVFSFSGFISSDYRKKLALDLNMFYRYTSEFNGHNFNINLQPRIRLGDRFFAIPQLVANYIVNDYGWSGQRGDSIIFGQRDRYIFTAAIQAQYVFNARSSLMLSLRHFYDDVDYRNNFLLREDGNLAAAGALYSDDINFNTLNIDLKYSWWFAPGSELVLLYRNVVSSNENQSIYGYFENLEKVLNSPMQNNISLRITYFLDYNTLRNKLRI